MATLQTIVEMIKNLSEEEQEKLLKEVIEEDTLEKMIMVGTERRNNR